MQNDIEFIMKTIKDIKNPVHISDEVSHFVIDSLRDRRINLYEAYMINNEVTRLKRLGYTQPAWNEDVRITTCIYLINQKLLAHIFNDSLMEKQLKVWAVEAFNLNKEKRPHYIMDRFDDFLEACQNPELLLELSDIRSGYEQLDYDEGPYHNEAFPFDFFSPEDILLDKEIKDQCSNNKIISNGIEDLIVGLTLI